MGLMDSINDTNDKALEVGEQYFKSTFKYFKLRFLQQLSISVSMVFKGVLIGGLALLGLLLSSTALAIFIGKSTNSYTLGFLSVGIIYIILSIIAYLFKGFINNVVLQKLSKKFFK